MFETHFSDIAIGHFVAAFLLLFASVTYFQKKRMAMSMLLLFLAGFTLRMLMTDIDPFLHIWDEQFHALVAKNMMSGLFHPVLVKDEVIPMDPAYWVNCHTWVHKPPLFLWQMALSMKIFGANVFAVRFPSALLSAFMIPAVYRMGKLIRNDQTGYIAALIIAFSNIHVDVVSGFLNTDHNDVVFAAYVLFSFWSFTEYVYSSKKSFIILTGIFTAAAVLTKWLPGFLVIGIWGIALLSDKEWRKSKKRWLDLFLAGIISLLLAMPWFIYVSMKWPVEWSATLQDFSKPFSQDLGHPGNLFFHFSTLKEQTGWVFMIALFLGMFFFFTRNTNRIIRVGFSAAVIFVFVFYTFVKAKMPLYCFMVYPLLIIIAAIAFDEAIEAWKNFFAKQKTFVLFFCFLVIGYLFLDLGRLESLHTERDPKEIYRKTRMANLHTFLEVDQKLQGNEVVFNCGSWNAAEFMFVTGVTAFDDLPTEENIRAIQKLGRPVLIFPGDNLPVWIKEKYSACIMRESLIRNGY
ncbi:MAG TPA: glycosyltransferase family 39 protein [Bacteroidia bacterium]|jgi:4-amino-4-deoxy-L-arabinose transferase|nr:glycosyltransferase family 39 protein [Bacteroidia bacterium]